MNDKPDFDALRAERNAAHYAWVKKMQAEGWIGVTPFNPNACYCACSSSGPCEHDWDGEQYESADKSLVSATCSKCGMTAFSHSMRNCP